MLYGTNNKKIAGMITAWSTYLREHHDWSKLITGIAGKTNGCGTVYELPNTLSRANESFALADMRTIGVVEPHYHAFGMWEVHVVLQGTAKVYIGTNEYSVQKDDIIIIPPEDAYYALPDKDFVVACLNTPAFHQDTYVVLTQDEPDHRFSLADFEKRTSSITK